MSEHNFEVNFVVNRDEAAAAHAAEAAAYRQHVADADKAAKAIVADLQAEARARKQGTTQALTDDQVATRARVELIKRENDSRVKAAAEAIAGTKKLRAEQAAADKQMANSAAAGSKLAGVLGSIGSAAFGFSGISSVIGEIAGAFQRARQQAEEAGKFAADYRATLKEIASLKGHNAPTAEVVKQDLDFRKQTLQDAAGARGVQENFMNLSASATDTKNPKGEVVTRKKISKEDAEAAMLFAGQQHARVGGDPGAIGMLAGIIPSMEKTERVSADQMKTRLAQLMQIGQAGGANPAQFASQIAASAGLVSSGAYRDPARMGAVGSTISLTTASEIGTGLDQLHRLTQGSLHDTTPGPGAKMSPADYMKSIGASAQTRVSDFYRSRRRDL